MIKKLKLLDRPTHFFVESDDNSCIEGLPDGVISLSSTASGASGETFTDFIVIKSVYIG